MQVRRRPVVVVALCLASAVLMSACGGVEVRGTQRPTTPTASDGPAAALADHAPVLSAQASAGLSVGLAGLGVAALSFPTLDQTLGPPSWVKPGTRITWYDAAASIKQSSNAWIEDPDGTWVDPATGKTYRRTDESGENQGSAGDGYGQLDVLAIDGTNVALSLSTLAIDHPDNSYIPGSSIGATVAGAEVDGYWIHPARLAQMQTVHEDGYMVLRGDYPLNGVTHHAVAFATTTPGAYEQYTYDTQTGVLLSSTTRTQLGPSQTSPEGNELLTFSQLAGVRQVTFPGIDGINPGWVASTPKLEYAGTYRWTNPLDPSTGSYTSPVHQSISLRPGGPAWESYASQQTVTGLNSTSQTSGLTGPTGVWWLSPQALATLVKLPSGQVLDKDPITGGQVLLRGVGKDPDTGHNIVLIEGKLPGITTQLGYDTTTGVLAHASFEQPVLGTSVDLKLQGGP